MSTVQSPPIWFAANSAPQTEQKLFYLDSVYLHGTIECIAGFDLIVALDGHEAPLGVYPVLINVEETAHLCTAYVWIPQESFSHKGLVVLDSDMYAKYYAACKLIEQSVHI